MVIAQHLRPAAARIAVGGNKGGGVDLEMGGGHGVHIARRHCSGDGARLAKQQPAALLRKGTVRMGQHIVAHGLQEQHGAGIA